MSEEVETVEAPVEPPPPEVVPEQPALTAEAPETPETPPEPEKDKDRKVRPDDPLISEITKLRAKNREREAENAKLRQEATAARELAERLSRGDKQPSTTETRTPVSDDAEVDRRAEYKVFVRDVNNMRADGIKEFGAKEFQESIGLLESYGAADDNFVSQVMSVDRVNAHKLLHDLARDPHQAIALVNMDPIRRVAELTRMSIARNPDGTFAPKEEVKAPVTPPKQVSKAPAPPPPVQPTSHKTVDFNSPEADKLSDSEWNKLWDERQQKRGRVRL